MNYHPRRVQKRGWLYDPEPDSSYALDNAELAAKLLDDHAAGLSIAPQTRLYFEAHITLAPVFGEAREALKMLGSNHGFRVADLLMRRARGGAAVPSQDDSFMTARSVDYSDIVERTRSMVQALRACGYSVRRYKVENTLVDSKAKEGDIWGLLQ